MTNECKRCEGRGGVRDPILLRVDVCPSCLGSGKLELEPTKPVLPPDSGWTQYFLTGDEQL